MHGQLFVEPCHECWRGGMFIGKLSSVNQNCLHSNDSKLLFYFKADYLMVYAATNSKFFSSMNHEIFPRSTNNHLRRPSLYQKKTVILMRSCLNVDPLEPPSPHPPTTQQARYPLNQQSRRKPWNHSGDFSVTLRRFRWYTALGAGQHWAMGFGQTDQIQSEWSTIDQYIQNIPKLHQSCISFIYKYIKPWPRGFSKNLFTFHQSQEAIYTNGRKHVFRVRPGKTSIWWPGKASDGLVWLFQ